ncbi:MAG TPA: universal stress protein [Thermoanaerobaculia bacterium]|jgi:nucleotide-binding universal stress UspA family protein|nr:universal stress protein [Thermoanaerobaculia bacterium]
MNIQRILHPTDLQPGSRYALPLAAELARKLDAELHVLHVEPMRGSVPLEVDEPAQLRMLKREPFLADMRLHTVCRQADDVATAIVAYAADHDVDLVVMSSQDLHGNLFRLLRSDALEVARRSTCSVLRLESDQLPELLRMRTLLVPFDYSHPSREALRWAAAIAARWGARIALFHVIPEPVLRAGSDSLKRSRWRETHRRQAELRLIDIAGYLAPGVPVTLDIHFGDPAREIVGRAAEGIDMVVMASHGMSAAKRLLIGSVAEEVQRLAAAPVLLVKAQPGEAAQRPDARRTA